MNTTEETSNKIAELANSKVADGVSVCECGLLEAVVELFHFPFSKPIVWSQEKNELKAIEYAVKLMHETPSGGISTKDTLTFFFEYCPFCGTKLTESKLEE